MSRRRIVAALGAVVLLLTGCSGTAGTTPSAAPSGRPPLTGSAPPTPAPAPTPPAVAFDGDCDAVLTSAEVTEAHGLTVGAVQRADDMPGIGIQASGGLACRWPRPDGHFGGLVVVALPDAAVPARLRSAYARPTCAPALDYTACRSAETVGGLWVLTWTEHLLGGEPPVDAPTAGHAELAALVVARATGIPAPRPPAPPAERLDCPTLAERMDLAALAGLPDISEGSGTDEGHRVEDLVAAALPTFLSCRWTLTDPAGDGWWAVAFDLVPGGAGAWDRAEATLPHPVGTLAVAGAERAVLSAGTDAYPAALISDGADLLRVSAPDRAGVRRGELSAAALRALAG